MACPWCGRFRPTAAKDNRQFDRVALTIDCLEPEEQAKNTEYSQDLFVQGMVKIDRPLGPACPDTEAVAPRQPATAALTATR